MNVNGCPQRTIWIKEGDSNVVQIIDQRKLPHQFVTADLHTVQEVAVAIKEMWVRGAPLIGATAAYGMYFAAKEALMSDDPETSLKTAAQILMATRPTAINLKWAIDRQMEALGKTQDKSEWVACALEVANQIVEEDVEICRLIGAHALQLIEEISRKKKGETVNILTHCNAGWVACIDWGTATSPIYQAFNKGIKVHVWVDETRPRNQGARITAWELGQHGVPHTVIVDNVGGHLMQHGMVDLCIVGTDRTTYTGDVANKIGTYLKALAAHDNGVPFYVALPSTSIDWKIRDGLKEIPIEERSSKEVTHIQGLNEETGELLKVLLTPPTSKGINYGFDVTPAKYVTALLTERGVCDANEEGIGQMFPDLMEKYVCKI